MPYSKKQKVSACIAYNVKIGKVSIYYLIEEQANNLTDIFYHLPQIIADIDLNKKKDFLLEYDIEKKKWFLEEDSD